MTKRAIRIDRLAHKIAFIIIFASIACAVIRYILGQVNASYMQLSVDVFAVPMQLLFAILCVEQVIYHINGSKRLLVVCYAVKLVLIYVFIREVHDVYVLVAKEEYIINLKKLLDGYGNGSPKFLNGVLASFAALIIFERVLSWMKDSTYSEWNPFSIADLRIQKFAGIILSSVYFSYFCYGTLGYTTYLSIAEKVTLLCGLFTVFWVQYPMGYSNFAYLIAKHIRRSAQLSIYFGDWIGVYNRTITEEQQRSYWMQSVCLPLLRKVNRLMSHNWESYNIENKLVVIRNILTFFVRWYYKFAQSIISRGEEQNTRAQKKLEKAQGEKENAEKELEKIEADAKSTEADREQAKAKVNRATAAFSKAKKVADSKDNWKEKGVYYNALRTLDATWMLSFIVGLGCAVSDNAYYLKRISRDVIGSINATNLAYAFRAGLVNGLVKRMDADRNKILQALSIQEIPMSVIPEAYQAHFDSNIKTAENKYLHIMDELEQEEVFYGESRKTHSVR